MESVDQEGDKTISLYGCDCAGCRRLVRNLEKTDKIKSSFVD
jgi:hypothetical protein